MSKHGERVDRGIYKRHRGGRTVYDSVVTLPKEPGQRYAKQVSKTFRTLSEARKWRRQTLTAVDKRTFVAPRRDLTLDAFLDDMRRLIEKDSRNKEVIFPYIGGEELSTSPTQEHHRFVINFGERGEDECRRLWPELMVIVFGRSRPPRELYDFSQRVSATIHELWKPATA